MAGKHIQAYVQEDLYLKFKMIAAVEHKTVADLLKEAIALIILDRNGEVDTMLTPRLADLLQESINLLRLQLACSSKMQQGGNPA